MSNPLSRNSKLFESELVALPVSASNELLQNASIGVSRLVMVENTASKIEPFDVAVSKLRSDPLHGVQAKTSLVSLRDIRKSVRTKLK
jgi:hypothetical protein